MVPGDNSGFAEARALQGDGPLKDMLNQMDSVTDGKNVQAILAKALDEISTVRSVVKRIGIYHSKDMDGYCSGAIMKLRYPDITLIGFNYGENIWEAMSNAKIQMSKGEEYEVIMADVSLPRDDMFKLAEWCGNRFTWIDHHKSAIEEFCISPPSRRINVCSPNNPDVFIKIYVEVGRAACELCWDYFMANSYEKNKFYEDIPEVVKYLGMYDTWRNEDKEYWDNMIMPFQYGMRLICTGVNDFPMNLLKRSEVFDPLRGLCETSRKCAEIRHDGRTVLKYQKQQNIRACRSAFEVEFEGLRAICLNNGGANSQLFESVWDEEKYDIMMPFVFNGKYWVFSIYTTKPDIDCSELAKRYGGGGHKQAAKFQVTDANWFAQYFWHK